MERTWGCQVENCHDNTGPLPSHEKHRARSPPHFPSLLVLGHWGGGSRSAGGAGPGPRWSWPCGPRQSLDTSLGLLCGHLHPSAGTAATLARASPFPRSPASLRPCVWDTQKVGTLWIFLPFSPPPEPQLYRVTSHTQPRPIAGAQASPRTRSQAAGWGGLRGCSRHSLPCS